MLLDCRRRMLVKSCGLEEWLELDDSKVTRGSILYHLSVQRMFHSFIVKYLPTEKKIDQPFRTVYNLATEF
jgi:hypothetical protein